MERSGVVNLINSFGGGSGLVALPPIPPRNTPIKRAHCAACCEWIVSDMASEYQDTLKDDQEYGFEWLGRLGIVRVGFSLLVELEVRLMMWSDARVLEWESRTWGQRPCSMTSKRNYLPLFGPDSDLDERLNRTAERIFRLADPEGE